MNKIYMSATKADEKIKITFTDKRKYYRAVRKYLKNGYHVFGITMK